MEAAQLDEEFVLLVKSIPAEADTTAVHWKWVGFFSRGRKKERRGKERKKIEGAKE